MDTDNTKGDKNSTQASPKEATGTCGQQSSGSEQTHVQNQLLNLEPTVPLASGSRYTLAPYKSPSKSPEKKKVKRGMKRVFEEVPVTVQKFSKFLVISRTEEHSFTKVSPFLINKLISQEFGNLSGVSKTSNGSLLIEASSKAQAEKLLQTSSLGAFCVKVEPHRTLNSSRGMVTCFDLEHSSDEEILDGLRDQGVIAVRRFFRKKRSGNGNEEAAEFTGSVMLTFNQPEIPHSVQAAFYKLKVRPYVPPPLRCFRCQRFGHSAARCKSQQEICICGHPSHSPDPCPTPPKCPNCDGPHSSRSRDCQEYKIEQEIQKMRTEIKNLTFREARVLVNSASYAWRGPYSSAVKNATETGENKSNVGQNNKKNKPPIPKSQTPTSLKSLPTPHPTPSTKTPTHPLPSTSSTPMDENLNTGKQFSPSSSLGATLPPPPPAISEPDCLGGLTDDGGGSYTSVKEGRKKGRPKGKRGAKKNSAESD